MTPQAARVRRIIASLLAGGVKHLVISPGSRSTPLVQAAAERPEWTLHSVLDERSASFFALGLQRSGKGLAATLCTSGTALAHALPAAIEAVESGQALVVVGADRPAAVRGWGAPQAIDQIGLLQPYAPTWEIDDTPEGEERLQQIPNHLRGLQRNGGAVALNVPLSLPLALAPGPLPALPQANEPPEIAELPRFSQPLDGERTVLVAGALPVDTQLASWLQRLQSAGRVVVLAESVSNLKTINGIIHFDALLRDPELLATLRPERIVRLGAYPVSKGLQLLLEDAKQRGIAVDAVHVRRCDPLQQSRQVIIGQPLVTMDHWQLDCGGTTDYVARWRLADAAAEKARRDQPSNWWEAIVIQGLCDTRPAHLLLGNSMPVRDWDSFATPSATTISCPRGASGIDGLLAQALGEAVGRQAPMTAYLGDCAFLHDVGSLQLLATSAHPAIRIVVSDNNGGAIFSWLPPAQAMSAEVHRQFFTTPHGLDLQAIARGFGIDAVRVADAASLRQALEAPLAPGQTQLVIATIDPDVSATLHRAFWQQAAAQARSALGVS